MCAPGYAFQEKKCKACPADNVRSKWSAGKRAGYGILVAILSACAYVYLFLVPLIPRLDAALNKVAHSSDAISHVENGCVQGCVRVVRFLMRRVLSAEMVIIIKQLCVCCAVLCCVVLCPWFSSLPRRRCSTSDASMNQKSEDIPVSQLTRDVRMHVSVVSVHIRRVDFLQVVTDMQEAIVAPWPPSFYAFQARGNALI